MGGILLFDGGGLGDRPKKFCENVPLFGGHFDIHVNISYLYMFTCNHVMDKYLFYLTKSRPPSLRVLGGLQADRYSYFKICWS